MIKNEENYAWAICDKCTFAQGLGFDCDRASALSAMDKWGWRYEGGKMMCCYCVEDERKERRHERS